MHIFRHQLYNARKIKTDGDFSLEMSSFHSSNIHIIDLNHGKLYAGQAITYVSVGNTAAIFRVVLFSPSSPLALGPSLGQGPLVARVSKQLRFWEGSVSPAPNS